MQLPCTQNLSTIESYTEYPDEFELTNDWLLSSNIILNFNNWRNNRTDKNLHIRINPSVSNINVPE
jgi:hypothetical protein